MFGFKIVSDASGKHILPKKSKRLLWVLLPKYVGLLILLLIVLLSSLHCTSAPNGAINYNTCLLYTSPSPRDVEESRMPSSA